MTNSSNFFYTIKVETTRIIFKNSSLTPEFKTRKQLNKYMLENFTEVTDYDIIKVVIELANK